MSAAQLRIYTINKGHMDEWLDLFHTHLVDRVHEAGMKISSSWVNVEKSQFIWIRTYDSLEDIAVREAEYYATDWWAECHHPSPQYPDRARPVISRMCRQFHDWRWRPSRRCARTSTP